MSAPRSARHAAASVGRDQLVLKLKKPHLECCPAPGFSGADDLCDNACRARVQANRRMRSIAPRETCPIPSELPDVLQFMQLLWAVVHGLERTSKRMTVEVGITGPQRLVLRVVGLFPGLSAGELASILHVHPSTLTGIIQRLVGQRLLQRVEHATDRRRCLLALTARGERINAQRGPTVESSIANALSGLSARDRAAARRVLEHLARHLLPGESSAERPARRPRTGALRRRT
jgi:DNA-binding MarR family transcriptional regulator